jgi:hypothetical protein
VGGKLFLSAKIAVLMQYEELHDFVQLILSLATTEIAQILQLRESSILGLGELDAVRNFKSGLQ